MNWPDEGNEWRPTDGVDAEKIRKKARAEQFVLTAAVKEKLK